MTNSDSTWGMVDEGALEHLPISERMLKMLQDLLCESIKDCDSWQDKQWQKQGKPSYEERRKFFGELTTFRMIHPDCPSFDLRPVYGEHGTEEA